MRFTDRLQAVKRLFLDTAPVIYFVEKNDRYFALLRAVFDTIDQGTIVAVTSPVTLAECLIVPYRLGQTQLLQAFEDLIVNGDNTVFVVIDDETARRTAELRAKYNLTLTDTIQLATALTADCDSFLTNDMALKRVAELNVIVLDDTEP
jgi:predicted nucleic acid-binding protein